MPSRGGYRGRGEMRGRGADFRGRGRGNEFRGRATEFRGRGGPFRGREDYNNSRIRDDFDINEDRNIRGMSHHRGHYARPDFRMSSYPESFDD
jgi:hypothetical protein